jgi:hypothetical protein
MGKEVYKCFRLDTDDHNYYLIYEYGGLKKNMDGFLLLH